MYRKPHFHNPTYESRIVKKIFPLGVITLGVKLYFVFEGNCLEIEGKNSVKTVKALLRKIKYI